MMTIYCFPYNESESWPQLSCHARFWMNNNLSVYLFRRNLEYSAWTFLWSCYGAFLSLLSLMAPGPHPLSLYSLKQLAHSSEVLLLCSVEERKSYGFVTTWGWVIDSKIFIFGWTTVFFFKKILFSTSLRYITCHCGKNISCSKTGIILSFKKDPWKTFHATTFLLFYQA